MTEDEGAVNTFFQRFQREYLVLVSPCRPSSQGIFLTAFTKKLKFSYKYYIVLYYSIYTRIPSCLDSL